MARIERDRETTVAHFEAITMTLHDELSRERGNSSQGIVTRERHSTLQVI